MFNLSNVFLQSRNSFSLLVCYPENQIDRNDVIFTPHPMNIMLHSENKIFLVFCHTSFFYFFFFIFSKNFNHLLTDWCLIWKYTFQFLKRTTDIHRLSNIRILTYGISGATGAERRSRACVPGGISLSPLRGQSLSSLLGTKIYNVILR